MVSVTERVKTLFLSPLQPRNVGGGGGGGGRGGIPCPLPSRPPHLRQPFQLTPTPSPAPYQRLFRTTKNCSVLGLGPLLWPLRARAPSPCPGPRILDWQALTPPKFSVSPGPNLGPALTCARCSPGDFELRHLLQLVAPIDFRSPGHPKRSAGRPA